MCAVNHELTDAVSTNMPAVPANAPISQFCSNRRSQQHHAHEHGADSAHSAGRWLVAPSSASPMACGAVSFTAARRSRARRRTRVDARRLTPSQ